MKLQILYWYESPFDEEHERLNDFLQNLILYSCNYLVFKVTVASHVSGE